MKDEEIIRTIEELMASQKQLSSRGNLSEREHKSLADIETRCSQYFDLLKQRAVLRESGKNPDEAKMRPADLVESYKAADFNSLIAAGYTENKHDRSKN